MNKGSSRWFVAFACLLLSVVGLAQAGAHPDFSGTWVLDLEASQPIEPLLRAQGRPWHERKIADSVVITQKVKQTPEVLTLDITSSVSSRTDVLKLDGTKETRQTERSGEVVTHSRWSEDGQQLVTVTEMRFEAGDTGQMIATRSIVDGGKTTHLLVEFTKPDGTHEKALRVLRKQ